MKQKILDEKEYGARCAYCLNGRIPLDRSLVLCKFKGVVQFEDSCRKFKYDPLKRVPNKMKISTDFSEEEFKL